jgi:uncharacterized ParB-like nuclease family protein
MRSAKIQTVPIQSLRRDGGTQIRAALDEATVAAYAEATAAGVKLPPVRVWDDGKTLWLSDGFHRVEASLRVGQKTVEVDRHVGGQRHALLDAVGANATHGLPRSNADKRRAIEALLADPEWVQWTDRRIAAAAHVGHELVARVREWSIGGNAIAPTRQAADGRKFPASRAKDSTPGQPTAAQFVQSAANPVDEGEKGAGVTGAAQPAAMHPAPAPDEPPPVDMLGLVASGEWMETVRVVVSTCEAIDRELRQLMASARSLPQPTQQRLWSALHDAAACARAVRPAVACPFCKATGGDCLSCAGNGWLSEEGKGGVHPAVLKPKVEKVEKVGRYAPAAKTLTIELVDDVPDLTDDDLAF